MLADSYSVQNGRQRNCGHLLQQTPEGQELPCAECHWAARMQGREGIPSGRPRGSDMDVQIISQSRYRLIEDSLGYVSRPALWESMDGTP